LEPESHTGPKAGYRCVQQIFGKSIGILSGRKPVAESKHRGTIHGGQQQPEDRSGGIGARECAGVDAPLNLMLDPLSEIPDETEPLPFPADARDSIIDKDQPEVLRLLLTEGIEAPHRLTNRLERVAVVLQCAAVLLQVMQTFLGQGEK